MAGLLLAVAACMDLTSTSPSVAAVVETTTTTTIPGSIAQATTTTEATTERESTYWEWDNGEEGSKSVHVGDHIRTTLDIDADLQCASIEWDLRDGEVLQNLGQAIAREGPFGVKAVKNYQVIGTGYARITAQGRWPDGHTQTFSWRVDLTGTE